MITAQKIALGNVKLPKDNIWYDHVYGKAKKGGWIVRNEVTGGKERVQEVHEYMKHKSNKKAPERNESKETLRIYPNLLQKISNGTVTNVQLEEKGQLLRQFRNSEKMDYSLLQKFKRRHPSKNELKMLENIKTAINNDTGENIGKEVTKTINAWEHKYLKPRVKTWTGMILNYMAWRMGTTNCTISDQAIFMVVDTPDWEKITPTKVLISTDSSRETKQANDMIAAKRMIKGIIKRCKNGKHKFALIALTILCHPYIKEGVNCGKENTQHANIISINYLDNEIRIVDPNQTTYNTTKWRVDALRKLFRPQIESGYDFRAYEDTMQRCHYQHGSLCRYSAPFSALRGMHFSQEFRPVLLDTITAIVNFERISTS